MHFSAKPMKPIDKPMDDNNDRNGGDESKDDTKVVDSTTDGDNEDVITMLDVLQEEQDLEDDAFAVLAGSDDKNCTYLKGYVSRQALYACQTCPLVATSAAEAENGCPPRAAICL
ncbi:unnamed protein product, partial [Oppiella nova]